MGLILLIAVIWVIWMCGQILWLGLSLIWLLFAEIWLRCFPDPKRSLLTRLCLG